MSNFSTTHMSNPISFSVNLKRIMEERNITRRQLSNTLNIKYTTICDWVNGNSVPRANSLAALAGYFGITVSDLFIDTDKPSKTLSRLSRYKEELTLSLNTLDFMTDEQITELINHGFTFKHRSLEEYVALTGRPIVPSPEIEYGKSQGDEIW